GPMLPPTPLTEWHLKHAAGSEKKSLRPRAHEPPSSSLGSEYGTGWPSVALGSTQGSNMRRSGSGRLVGSPLAAAASSLDLHPTSKGVLSRRGGFLSSRLIGRGSSNLLKWTVTNSLTFCFVPGTVSIFSK